MTDFIPLSQKTQKIPSISFQDTPQNKLWDILLEEIKSYLPEDEIKLVQRAYFEAESAHAGQKRQTGEPYITHPLTVAYILAHMNMDVSTVCAGLLHDVLEDTTITEEMLQTRFNKETVCLIKGVTKITHFSRKTVKNISKSHMQAENFQRLLVASTRDIRILIIKLVDRLHNIRTLGTLPAQKRHRIAKETNELYIPIALRLGMHKLAQELDDACLQLLHHFRYRKIEELLHSIEKQVISHINQASNLIQNKLNAQNIEAKLESRLKSPSSIYRKLIQKHSSASETHQFFSGDHLHTIHDIFAFRIITQTVVECYQILGILHNLYKPHFEGFKDYIASPKNNGYQALHTLLVGPKDYLFEVQIKTKDMHQIAQYGIAAHWSYKSQWTKETVLRVQKWLNQITQNSSDMTLQLFHKSKQDDTYLPDDDDENIFVLSPQGDIFRLPIGASAIDFAYAIHSDLGNKCLSCEIDGQSMSITTKLATGQTVNIIMSQIVMVKSQWLLHVITPKALVNINEYLKALKQTDWYEIGETMFQSAFNILNIKPTNNHYRIILTYAKSIKKHKINNLKDLYYITAQGCLSPLSIISHALEIILSFGGKDTLSELQKIYQSQINFATCCLPIPGDTFIGYLSPNKGLIIHRQNCSNIQDWRMHIEHYIFLKWETSIKEDFLTEIVIDTKNHDRSILASISRILMDEDLLIQDMRLIERESILNKISLRFFVKNRKQLASALKKLRKHPHISRINRT